MNHFGKAVICLGVILFVAVPVFAQSPEASDAGPGEAWYKIVTGIIAIPAALLGLIISYNLLRKTTLESRKLELEIQEKQTKRDDAIQTQLGCGDLSEPTSSNQRALLLIVRFIVLELTLRCWNIVPSIFSQVLNALNVGHYALWTVFMKGDYAPPEAMVTATLAIAPTVVTFLFSIIYWFMVFGFGWPLLKDTCRFMGIPVEGLLDLPYLGRRKKSKSME